MLRQALITPLIRLIQQNKDDVKARQHGCTHLEVLQQRLGSVVLATSRVGSSKQAGARWQGGHQACLCHTHLLLLQGAKQCLLTSKHRH